MKRVFFLIITLILVASAKVDTNIINSLNSPHKALINKLYSLNNYNYFWLGAQNGAKMSKVVNALSNKFYNYKEKPLHRVEITRLIYTLDAGGLSPYNQAKLDVLITDAYIRLLHFIRIGDVNWNLVQKKINSIRKRYDIKAVWQLHVKSMPSAATIYKYIQSNRVNALLMQSIGQMQRYKPFIDLLVYYQKIPLFKKIKYGSVIKYGHRDRRIYEIKRRLMILGDYPRKPSINNKFDRDLAYAIKKFKDRFNLRGGYNYIDNKLLAYLNLPKSYYIKKIMTNLDKTKVFLPNFGSTYVEVNVPEFKMRFYKNGIEAFSSNIVVGRLDRPTPIFDDYLEYVVVNPTWSVPENLVKKDLIPALKQNPNLLQEAHIDAYQGGKKVTPNLEKLFKYENSNRALPYHFVQRPGGSTNALGYVKFMFPNRYSVYLHDTPERGLFSHKYRYNSSGCMRLEDPAGFFEVLKPYMSNPNLDFSSLVNSGKTTRVNLRQKIPVHIVYFTLEFENGAPKFMYDAYMYDKIVEESTAGNIKYNFEVPEVRLREVKSK